MIKSAIIFVLLILLLGGAFLSRPTKQSFENFMREQAKSTTQNPFTKWFANNQLDRYLESVTFKDRYLWVEVQSEGKTNFVGVFSRFFAIGIDSKNAEPAKVLDAAASGI